jgi:hypothetical protein
MLSLKKILSHRQDLLAKKTQLRKLAGVSAPS